MIKIFMKSNDCFYNMRITSGPKDIFGLPDDGFCILNTEATLAEPWYPGDSIVYKGFITNIVKKTGTLVFVDSDGTAIIIASTDESIVKIPWGRWMFNDE